MQEYNRQNARDYARKWALYRNPAYKNYELYGGNCTNFVSQCLVAGGMAFDHTGRDLTHRWYWYSDGYRTPSFTSASALRRYFRLSHEQGIIAKEVGFEQLEMGDIVFKSVDGMLTHSMLITDKIKDDNGRIVDYKICQNSDDLLDFPLSQKTGDLSYYTIIGCK